MTQWRIRVTLPESGDGPGVLTGALARLPLTGLTFTRDGDAAGTTDGQAAKPSGELIVELAEDGALDDLLRALHEISPRVFISRIGTP